MGEKERLLIYNMLGFPKGKAGFDLGEIVEGSVSGIDRMLVPGEIPRATVFGMLPSNRLGLLVATDSRLIAFDSEKGLLIRAVKENMTEIPYDMIKTLNYSLGWMFGEITIESFADGNLSVKRVHKQVIPTFANWVRGRIGYMGSDIPARRGEHTTLASLSVGGPRSLADELTKLADLRESGVLSEPEFLEAKKRLLNNK